MLCWARHILGIRRSTSSGREMPQFGEDGHHGVHHVILQVLLVL